MDRWLVATLAASAAGFLVLGTWAEAAQVPLAAMDDLEGREGERVCVQARLVQVRALASGSTKFVLVHQDRSLHGWARFAWAATPGDTVEACGVLVRAGQTLELQPARPRDLSILEAYDAQARPLAALAARPWEYVGQRVTVWGPIERVGTVSWIVDAAGAARLPLVGADPEAATWAHVDAWVEYDAGRARFALRVETVRPGDGAQPWTS